MARMHISRRVMSSWAALTRISRCSVRGTATFNCRTSSRNRDFGGRSRGELCSAEDCDHRNDDRPGVVSWAPVRDRGLLAPNDPSFRVGLAWVVASI